MSILAQLFFFGAPATGRRSRFGALCLCLLLLVITWALSGCGEISTIPDAAVRVLSPADRSSNGPNQHTHVDVDVVNESALSVQSVQHLVEVLNAHRAQFAQDWLVDYSATVASGLRDNHYSIVLRDTLDTQLLRTDVLGYHAGTVGYVDVNRAAVWPLGVITTASHELVEVLIDPAGTGKEIADYCHSNAYPDGFTDYMLPVAYTDQTAPAYDVLGIIKTKPDPGDRKLYAK